MNKIPSHELAFDVDGVIADTFRLFVKMARHQYGVEVEYEDIVEYDFRKVIDIDEQVCREIIGGILDDPLGVGIEPVNGSMAVLNRLLDMGPVLLVTARPEREAILKWFQAHLGLQDTSGIHLKATGTHTEKIPILLEHGVKYFVEDRLDTCYLLDEISVTPIVFEQPWNQQPHPFQTVKTWEDISALIAW
jgi:uncharacterized protein